jgi:predicted metal-dependent HD superfamily phosphohydrolase
MQYGEILNKAENYISELYRLNAAKNLYYHNYEHAMEVLANTKKIGAHYQLNDQLFFIVCAAACFHDSGILVPGDLLHEDKSASLADDFFQQAGVSGDDIAAIKRCILATKMPQEPQTLEEEIICDADLFNLGTAEFKEKNKQLKKETEARTNTKIDGLDWRASSISLLENHRYHTTWCQELLNETKAENLAWLKSKQQEKLLELQLAATEPLNEAGGAPENGVPGKKDKVKDKDKPVKGIETMFRISSANNVRVSVMADNKAHIMITVNSIILSVLLGLVLKNPDENPHVLIPSFILLAVSVTTIIYSVLATRPHIGDGEFTKEQVEKKSVNLLYFGSFYKMNFKEYNEGIKAMMADSEFLYGSLTKDIFWQGKVLGRKYRLLRISYTIFMYGLIAAVIAYAVSAIIYM